MNRRLVPERISFGKYFIHNWKTAFPSLYFIPDRHFYMLLTNYPHYKHIYKTAKLTCLVPCEFNAPPSQRQSSVLFCFFVSFWVETAT